MLRQQHLTWLSAVGSPNCLVCVRTCVHAHEDAHAFAQARPARLSQVCSRRRLLRARRRRTARLSVPPCRTAAGAVHNVLSRGMRREFAPPGKKTHTTEPEEGHRQPAPCSVGRTMATRTNLYSHTSVPGHGTQIGARGRSRADRCLRWTPARHLLRLRHARHFLPGHPPLH